MPKTITQVNTADNYTEQGGANINSAYQSKGGWVALPAQVLAQIQHSSAPDNSQGQEQWSDEFVLPSGAHYLQPGIIGIRFRSFTPGNPVAVSAAIFYRDEYAIQLGGSGISTPGSNVASLNFQHNDIAVATEPTADFEDQSGSATMNLTWTVVDDPANTRVKITPVPVWASPTVFPHSISTGPATDTMTGTQSAGVFLDQTFSLSWFTAICSGPQTVFNTFHTTDTNSRFNINDAGSIQWGPGGASGTDTQLFRSGAATLSLTSTLIAGSGSNSAILSGTNASLYFGSFDTQLFRSSAGQIKFAGSMFGSLNSAALNAGGDGVNPSLHMYSSANHNAFVSVPIAGFFGYLTSRVADTNWRFEIDSDGVHHWGDGTNALDANLYRNASGGNIRTDGTFWAGQSLVVDASSGANRLYLGGALDTFIVRNSAGQVYLSNQLSVNTPATGGTGTITASDRIFSGAASTGGIWVDGGTNQFFGSNSASLIGIYNTGWKFLIDASGNATINGSYGFQTGVGVGGTVTQLTNRTTAVTLNKICGSITTNGTTNVAGIYSFTVNNSTVGANDVIILGLTDISTNIDFYTVKGIAAGSFIISYHMTVSNSVSYVFNFTVIHSSIN